MFAPKIDGLFVLVTMNYVHYADPEINKVGIIVSNIFDFVVFCDNFFCFCIILSIMSIGIILCLPVNFHSNCSLS